MVDPLQLRISSLQRNFKALSGPMGLDAMRRSGLEGEGPPQAGVTRRSA